MRTASQRNARALLFGAIATFLLGGCASVDKVKYPNSANPQEEVSKLQEEFGQTESAQNDVLAPKEYDRAVKHFNEAKRELADKDKDDFWDELGTSKAYLDKANQLAAVRGQRVQGVLQARQKAIECPWRLRATV